MTLTDNNPIYRRYNPFGIIAKRNKNNPYGYDEDIWSIAGQSIKTDATGRWIREDLSHAQNKKINIPIPKRRPEIIEPTKKGNELLDFIGRLESSDNYNIIYGNQQKPLTKMTIKQVYQLQESMIKNGQGSSAVGRYQIKKTTLKETANKLGIRDNEFFDEKMQDQLARSLMERRGFERYKAGEINTNEFIKGLAREWAALPSDTTNKSRYEGIGNNKALTDFKTLKKLLEQ